MHYQRLHKSDCYDGEEAGEEADSNTPLCKVCSVDTSVKYHYPCS